MIEMISKSDYILQHYRFYSQIFHTKMHRPSICAYKCFVCSAVCVHYPIFEAVEIEYYISDDRMVYLWIYEGYIYMLLCTCKVFERFIFFSQAEISYFNRKCTTLGLLTLGRLLTLKSKLLFFSN